MIRVQDQTRKLDTIPNDGASPATNDRSCCSKLGRGTIIEPNTLDDWVANQGKKDTLKFNKALLKMAQDKLKHQKDNEMLVKHIVRNGRLSQPKPDECKDI